MKDHEDNAISPENATKKCCLQTTHCGRFVSTTKEIDRLADSFSPIKKKGIRMKCKFPMLFWKTTWNVFLISWDKKKKNFPTPKNIRNGKRHLLTGDSLHYSIFKYRLCSPSLLLNPHKKNLPTRLALSGNAPLLHPHFRNSFGERWDGVDFAFVTKLGGEHPYRVRRVLSGEISQIFAREWMSMRMVQMRIG